MSDQTPSAPQTDAEKQAAPAPKPTPKPRPMPGPRPSAVQAAAPAAAAAAPQQADRTAALAEARKHGRVDEDGTVYLTAGVAERAVGQYPDADAEAALDYYAAKYLDLVDGAAVLEERLAAGAPAQEIRSAAAARREQLADAKVVGDVSALDARLAELETAAQAAEGEQRAAREAAKEAGRAERIAVVEEAEALAAQDPDRIRWNDTSARIRELFDRWKRAQAEHPKLPRSEDQALWKRFSAARSTLDRGRREFFAARDTRSAEGKRIKEKLVARAEELSTSTDWRTTGGKYRDLMQEWKAAPRAGRKDDDALWARFRAAQDVFFAARDAENEKIDAGYRENLVVKERLLAEAQALLPITDPEAAKAALRPIQSAWEEAGRVPRADVSRIEGGLREVERALAEAEDEQWKRTNPENRARTSGALSQLEEAIAGLEADVEKAKASGDADALKRAESALEARRAWYDQLKQTAEELG